MRLSAGRPCTVRGHERLPGHAGPAAAEPIPPVVLFPTDEQWTAGERWVRCDVVLLGGTAAEVVHRHGGRPRRRHARRPSSTSARRPSRTRRPRPPYPCLNPRKNWIKVLDQELGGPGSRFPGTGTGREAHAQPVREAGQEVVRQGEVPRLVGHLADLDRLEAGQAVGAVLRALHASTSSRSPSTPPAPTPTPTAPEPDPQPAPRRDRSRRRSSPARASWDPVVSAAGCAARRRGTSSRSPARSPAAGRTARC